MIDTEYKIYYGENYSTGKQHRLTASGWIWCGSGSTSSYGASRLNIRGEYIKGETVLSNPCVKCFGKPEETGELHTPDEKPRLNVDKARALIDVIYSRYSELLETVSGFDPADIQRELEFNAENNYDEYNYDKDHLAKVRQMIHLLTIVFEKKDN